MGRLQCARAFVLKAFRSEINRRAQVIGFLGIVYDHKPRSVILRPIPNLATDLRDHHLRARWHRLMRRWRKA